MQNISTIVTGNVDLFLTNNSDVFPFNFPFQRHYGRVSIEIPYVEKGCVYLPRQSTKFHNVLERKLAIRTGFTVFEDMAHQIVLKLLPGYYDYTKAMNRPSGNGIMGNMISPTSTPLKGLYPFLSVSLCNSFPDSVTNMNMYTLHLCYF